MLAFVHIKKTAGTTLTAILRRNFGTRHLDTRLHLYEDLFLADDLRRALKLYRRLDCIAGHHVRPIWRFALSDPENPLLHICTGTHLPTCVGFPIQTQLPDPPGNPTPGHDGVVPYLVERPTQSAGSEPSRLRGQ